MINIDLKLLSVIAELHRTRSVSIAAENLGVSQSSVSMSLARLRKHFADPLFVRTSAGMEPTPHAAELIDMLKDAEGLLHKALEHRVVFDAAVSDRVFHLCSTDIAQLTLLPSLVKRLNKVGPSLRVTLRNISHDTPKWLESGEVDLAVGFIPAIGAGFYGQKLFQDRFVCIVRTGHPRVGKTITAEQFQTETQVAVATSGTGHSMIVEKVLEDRKIHRKVGLRVPSFIGLGPLIANTDMLAILPEQLGAFFAKFGQVRLLELPFEIESYDIMQHWHERFRFDPASKWFRGIIADLFLNSPAPPRSST